MPDAAPQKTPDEAPVEAPSPLLTWKALYILLAITLVVEIGAFSALTWMYR